MANYQTWPYGYVALPTLCASRHALQSLRDDPCTLDELAARLCANRGHLGVAVRTLCALGWVRMEGAIVVVGKHTMAAADDPLLRRLCMDVYYDSKGVLVRLAP